MYPWKCWRDTRSTFLVILGAVVVIGGFGLTVTFDPFGWIAAAHLSPALLKEIARGLSGITPWLVLLGGFVLGGVSIGLEFEKGTAEFLLTRPRSRRYFVWTSWLVGETEMLLLMLLSVLQFGLLRGSPVSGTGLLRVTVIFCALATVIYSITFLMTALTRSSRNGTSFAIAVCIIYTGVTLFLNQWFHLRIPGILEWLERRGPDWPMVATAWIAFSLLLVYGAERYVQRAET